MPADAKSGGVTADFQAARRARAAGPPRRAARLAAVQALYQIELSGNPAEAVLGEFLDGRLGEEIDGLRLDQADRNLLGALVTGVAAEVADLDDMLSAVLADDWPIERLETVLRVILRAGAYELGYRREIPARVTITEYVNLARAFFGGKEPGLVNGVLDRLARALRTEEFEAAEARPEPSGPE